MAYLMKLYNGDLYNILCWKHDKAVQTNSVIKDMILISS